MRGGGAVLILEFISDKNILYLIDTSICRIYLN